LANVDAKYVFVEALGRASDDQCCVRYTIIVNAEVSSGENVNGHRDAIANAIGSNPDFQPDTSSTGTTTDATVAAASSLVPLFFALVALLVVVI